MFGEPPACPICGHSFIFDVTDGSRLVGVSPSGMFLETHLQNNHPDYVAWKDSKLKLVGKLTIITTIIFDTFLAYVVFMYGIRLPPGRASAGPFAAIAVPAFLLWFLLISRWGNRKFRREWKERGGLTAPSSSVGLRSWTVVMVSGAADKLREEVAHHFVE